MLRHTLWIVALALVGCQGPVPVGAPAPDRLAGPYTGSFEPAYPAAAAPAPEAAPAVASTPRAAPSRRAQPAAAGSLPAPTIRGGGARPATAPATAPTPATPQRTTAANAFTFRLHVGDELSVSVWKEPELATKQRVLPDGTFTPPLLGTVRAEGLTLEELRSTLTQQYRTYIKDPKVSVHIDGIYSDRVFVLGEVGDAQAVPLHGPTTVLQAISQAGGFEEDNAQRQVIRLVRRGPQGRALVYNVDALAVLSGRRSDPPVQRGDIVYVTATGETEWVRTVGKALQPIAAGLGSLGAIAGTTAAIIALK